jgi:apolipoprotein N-acyltransferase
VWVGVEMIRSLIPGLGTGAFIGYAFAFVPQLIQPISIFGIFGLSLVTMMVAYALALAVLAWMDTRWRPDGRATPVSPRLARHWLVAAGGLAVAWAGASLVLDRPSDTPRVRAAAVQTGAPQPSQAAHLELLSGQTRQAASEGAELVVWPEGSLGFDPRVSHTSELQALARETGAYLVIGYALETEQGLRNEATVLSPDGQFLGTYGKDHPVTLLGETSVSGGSYPTYETPIGTLGTIICFDLVFTDSARKTAAGGAQLVGVPSNDWQALADKEYTYLIFRAVENRMAMVKADTQYDSAIIDPHGRIVYLAAHTRGGPALLVADVSLGTASAPQIRLGDWIGWLCLAGLAFFALPNPLLRKSLRATESESPA